MVQRFTLLTAVLTLSVWLAVLVGTIVGPLWLALAGWIGVIAVTGWTLFSTCRAGEDPFPDLRDRPEVREDQTLPEATP
jgi:pheromone shutdown protein TraB